MQERKLYVLDEPIPEEPAANASRAQRDTYIKHQNDSVDVKCLMLATMESELQKQMVDMEEFNMIAISRKCSKSRPALRGLPP